MKLDICSLGNDPDIRKSGRNLLEVLESEDTRFMRSPNMLAMVSPELWAFEPLKGMKNVSLLLPNLKPLSW
jgi:hypothetical protein